MKIILCGRIGSGKSSIGKKVASDLNLKFYSTGGLMRDLAQEQEMKAHEFSHKRTDDIDKLVDDRTTKIGKEEDNFLFDSKLAFNFIEGAYVIFLEVSEEVAAHRIFIDQRDSEKNAESEEELKERIHDRWETDRQRYIRMYGVDINDTSNYDRIIDTTNLTIDEVITEVKRAIQALR